jgi:hypothetical protein
MKRSSVGFAMALAALLAACGGDDSGKTDDAQGKAGSSGGPKKGEVPCGSATCKVPSGVTGEACCKDQFAAACGIKPTATGTCRELPKTDERCPVPDIMVSMPGGGNAAMSTYGCCTANNECGIDFGAGCQSRTFACMVIGADQVDKVKPQTCDGDPLPLPANCGMNMIRIPGGAAAGQSGGT